MDLVTIQDAADWEGGIMNRDLVGASSRLRACAEVWLWGDDRKK